jgi:uncharacterized SAM-binding protein YcdF (DUF218 family)
MAKKVASDRPSFVYRAVLNEVAQIYPQSEIILAPANTFGGRLSEQEAGYRYLKKKGLNAVFFPSLSGKYIDTRGNAHYLRMWLISQNRWPLEPVMLISARHHARRAKLCFKKEGFSIKKTIAVSYAIPGNESIVPRLWYYKFPTVHILYEAAAYLYDFFRPSTKYCSEI